MIVREMREADCYDVVRRQAVARLASCANDQPYVVPVTFMLSEGLIYSFSMPGRKIDNMRANPKVCLQIEEIQNPWYWKSVVIEGRFRELSSAGDRQQAWEVLQQRSNWWEPGALKPTASNVIAGSSPHLFYTITIDRLSGREAADG